GRSRALPGRSGVRVLGRAQARAGARALAGARRSARRARARRRRRCTGTAPRTGGRWRDAALACPAAPTTAPPHRSEEAVSLVRYARARRACAPRRLAPRPTPRPLHALLPLGRGSAEGVGAQPGAGYRAMTETETGTATDEQPTTPTTGGQRLTS